MLRPKDIVPGMNVNLTVSDYVNDAEGLGVTSRKGSRFDIQIFKKPCEETLNASWLKGKMTLDQFMFGIALHEVAHIKYGSFTQIPDARTKVWNFIDNVIEDARIEYRLSLDYPTFSPYFSRILSAVRQSYTNSNDPDDAFVKRMDSLFQLVRFGVNSGLDDEFTSFCLPITLSSKRSGSRGNAVLATNAIYDYVKHAVDEESAKTGHVSSPMGGKTVTKSIDQGEIDSIELDSQIAPSTTTNTFGMDDTQLQTSLSAGFDEIEINDRDNSFCKQVRQNNVREIEAMRNMIKKLVDHTASVASYEGDIDVIKQQDAFHASFTGEPVKAYIKRQKTTAGLDFVIIRDVSGSTNSVKDDYAKAVAIPMIAVDDMPGVRTACVDFNGTHKITKSFDQKVNESSIYPNSGGGTILAPSLEAALAMKWEHRHKVVLVITDGDWGDPTAANVQAAKLIEKGIAVVMVGTDRYAGLDVSKLPEIINENMRRVYA